MSSISLPLAFFDFVNVPARVKPFWHIAGGGIAAVVVLALAFALLNLVLPKVAAIAWTTGKEAVLQPLFTFCWFGGIAAATTVRVPALLHVRRRHQGRGRERPEGGDVAVHLPGSVDRQRVVGRGDRRPYGTHRALQADQPPRFCLGKFLGILGPVALLFILLGMFFLGSVSFKVFYDARESSLPEPNSLQCLQEVMHIAPGLVLGFLEATMMVSISVAISTRLGILPNLVIVIRFTCWGISCRCWPSRPWDR